MTARPTIASTNERLDGLEGSLVKLTELLTGIAAAQHATPTAVATVTALPTQRKTKATKAKTEKVTAPVETPAPVAEPVVETPAEPVVKVTTASLAGDSLMQFVEGKKLAFAKGGRTNLDRPALAAVARVLKTGTAEVVSVTAEALVKRGISGLAIGLNGEGGVLTQYVYDPSKTRN